MPFGCFGKRKKPERADKPNDKTAIDGAVNNSSPVDGEIVVTKPVEDKRADEEVNESITVARAHSLHASAPNSVEHRHTTIGIQKSATLARYDFLRKSDYTNTADRWAALKQQYLAPHAGQNGSAGGAGRNAADARVKQRAAMSLPRQFAPTNSASSVVRFSQWFYERQTMEADARREFHEREEKTRKLLDGVVNADNSIPEKSIKGPEIGANSREGDVQPEQAGANDTASTEQIDEEKAEEADVQLERVVEDAEVVNSSPAKEALEQPTADSEAEVTNAAKEVESDQTGEEEPVEKPDDSVAQDTLKEEDTRPIKNDEADANTEEDHREEIVEKSTKLSTNNAHEDQSTSDSVDGLKVLEVDNPENRD